MRYVRFAIIVCVLLLSATMVIGPNPAEAASAQELSRDAKRALTNLYAAEASARALGEKAKAVLVFPGIVKGGFIVGGQYGEGALFMNGQIVGYYNTVSVSYGLQAGLQKYGYAVFFMTEAAVRYLDKSGGFELGTAPNIVVVDKGLAGSLSTTTLQSDMYAFFFSPQGLMAGLGLQGTKVTKIAK